MSRATPRRRALLMGCGTFADDSLAPLRAPRRDVGALASTLKDPVIGGYEVTEVIDATSREALRSAERFLKDARPSDALNLLYLSCHGIQDPQGRLHFAFADTECDLLTSTTVPAELIRNLIYNSRSKATVVLIDCCFSGAFIKGMQARSTTAHGVDALVHDLPEGSGVAVLTASGENEASFEDTDAPEARPSYFTEAVVMGLATGAADLGGDGEITVDELYEYIYDRVLNGRSPQRPRKFGTGEGRLVIANAAAPTAPREHAAVREARMPAAPPESTPEVAAACRDLLDRYADEVRGATDLVLASPDGLPILVLGEMRRDEAERSAALVYGLVAAAWAATAQTAAGPARHCVVNLHSGALLVKPIGECAVLGVLLDNADDVERAIDRVAGLAEQLAVKLEHADLRMLVDELVARANTGRLPLVDCSGRVHVDQT
ncbi:caspase family protein [Micromonospora chalcea]